MDFVVNHGSMDSKLIDENPHYFLNKSNTTPKGDYYFDYSRQGKTFRIAHGGFFCYGSLYTWADTSQIDYSNPATQDRMTKVVRSWVERFDVDGFRVDMAYIVLNSVFGPTWNRKMPQNEFYAKLIPAVRAVKPSTAFIAEAYDQQDQLSALGFDMIYNKNETNPARSQTGLYNAIEDAKPQEERDALDRAAFLAWQDGGAGGLNFVGNHDEPAPEKVFGQRLPAAAMMTMLTPAGFMLYNGAEIGTDNSIPTEQKTLPFNVPNKIDWNGGDPKVRALYKTMFAQVNSIRAEMGDYDMTPIRDAGDHNWVGYTMVSKTHPGRKKVIISNLSSDKTEVDINALGLHCSLAQGEYRIVDASKR